MQKFRKLQYPICNARTALGSFSIACWCDCLAGRGILPPAFLLCSPCTAICNGDSLPLGLINPDPHCLIVTRLHLPIPRPSTLCGSRVFASTLGLVRNSARPPTRRPRSIRPSSEWICPCLACDGCLAPAPNQSIPCIG